MSNRFEGKRALVTQLDRYMGMPLGRWLGHHYGIRR
jgi:hypothetical protein